MKNLIPIILHRGYDVKVFSKQVLGITYRAFKYQVDERKMKYDDIVKVLSVLGIDFKDLSSQQIFLPEKKNIDFSKKNPYEKQSEQKFGELYAHLLKSPYKKQLLMSIMQGEKYLTLKQFCKRYNVVVGFTSAKRKQ